jgi:hypothetical protein
MNENKLESDFIYYANKREGVSTYEKTPCPTKECFETIGQEGIDFIVNKVKELVRMRIYMFGNGKPEYYGLPRSLRFAHLPSCSVISVSDYPYRMKSSYLQYPELIDKEHFVIEAESVKDRMSKDSLQRIYSRGESELRRRNRKKNEAR